MYQDLGTGYIETPDGEWIPVHYSGYTVTPAHFDPNRPATPSRIAFTEGNIDQDRFLVYMFAYGGTYYPTILSREDIPMEVIAGPKGLAVARLVARAQLNRVKGMLKGGAAAPYLTARSRRVPMRETGTVNPWDSVILKDNAGAIKNYQWLFDTFGPITLERAPGVKCVDGKTRVMRLIEAQESIGPAVIVVKILKEDGSPWENMCVARGWPGAPGIPGTPPETIRWREEGVYGFTGVNGDIGYGLGTGDYYWRYDTQAGVSYVFTLGVMDEGVWTEGGGIPSDFVNGTGMLGGTEHQGLLRFKYQWVEVDGDEEPEPEDDEIVALLIEIRDLLAAGGGSFPAELNFAGKIKLPT